MAQPIGDLLHPVRPVPIKGGQQCGGEIAIGEFDTATDVVGLAGLAAAQHDLDAAAVIVHVQPIANIEPVAVERHLAIADEIRDKQWNDFFGKLIGPVVIGAARTRNIEPVGDVIGAHQELRRCLRRGVRRVR